MDVQRATTDVRDAVSGGVGAGVDDGTGRVERPRGRAAGQEIDDVRAAREGERGEGCGPVGGVGDDAARLLPGPLAPGPLLGRQVLVAAGLERARIGYQALLPRCQRRATRGT